MKLFTRIDEIPVFNKAVITIGSFDGVHTGHMAIIHELQREADSVHGDPVLITFHPHPSQVINGRPPVEVLNSREEKLLLLQKARLPYVVEIPFSIEFAEQSADAYIRDFLWKGFHPYAIVTGYDHRFGRERLGDYHLLEKAGIEYGFKVKEIPAHLLESAAISSTRIRKALKSGNITEANQLLGYSYFFTGTVIKGNQLGRTLGYPTANLKLADSSKLIPGHGVYAVTCTLAGDGKVFSGMMNIGVRPTVDGTTSVIEVNIFDFDKEIYGEQLTVMVHFKLRDERKFASLDALSAQLAEDKKLAMESLDDL